MSGIVNDWLAAAGRYPLLTPSQELDLGHKIQRGLADDATPTQKRIGNRARQKLITSNLRLVMNVAKKFSITVSEADCTLPNDRNIVTPEIINLEKVLRHAFQKFANS